ncbi:Na+-transporting methylmalonyl-CoA/oxaloacetate decarboxylase gamma subunit [Clostridium pascui]|uniref:OadG family protein n=1 Tax=Clostridium pascui TaxID=46609 RepID=UPI00195C7B25|nr:OadG family protein [Clostridium pascui]MBM7869679.1 Na+-transporting methylmalonyl-CoA/oxaloacetate decarboxylase gamma subunit [Clostridium pascui]
MSVLESILVALFVMSIVFAVLIALSLFLNLQSKCFHFFKKKAKLATIAQGKNTLEVLTDKTTFVDVDEKTVAIIAASISHASNIPLKSVKIKSIRPLDV